MSRKSQKIRASRREKMAMRWPNMKKPAVGRIHGRLEAIGNEAYCSDRPRDPARSTGQMTD